MYQKYISHSGSYLGEGKILHIKKIYQLQHFLYRIYNNLDHLN